MKSLEDRYMEDSVGEQDTKPDWAKCPQTEEDARKLWNLGPKDDLYDIYGSAAIFLR